jgi:hypothetical protein
MGCSHESSNTYEHGGSGETKERRRGSNSEEQEKENRQVAQTKSSEGNYTNRACAKMQTVGVGEGGPLGRSNSMFGCWRRIYVRVLVLEGRQDSNLWSRHPKTPAKRPQVLRGTMLYFAMNFIVLVCKSRSPRL